MSGDGPDRDGITQRELLIEMRDDIREPRSVLEAVARDRALSCERRACMQRGQRAIEWLSSIVERMQTADVPKEKADLRHAIYERKTVAGPEIVGVRLTAAAYAHGLALALPEKVEVARPTGVRRPRAHSGFRFVPIQGADWWEAAARNSA